MRGQRGRKQRECCGHEGAVQRKDGVVAVRASCVCGCHAGRGRMCGVCEPCKAARDVVVAAGVHRGCLACSQRCCRSAVSASHWLHLVPRCDTVRLEVTTLCAIRGKHDLQFTQPFLLLVLHAVNMPLPCRSAIVELSASSGSSSPNAPLSPNHAQRRCHEGQPRCCPCLEAVWSAAPRASRGLAGALARRRHCPGLCAAWRGMQSSCASEHRMWVA